MFKLDLIKEAIATMRRQDGAPLRICLAGSGGGHVRQLLDLEKVWSRYDFFFITEESALSRSFPDKWETHYVAHYAIGQAKLTGWLHFIQSIKDNLTKSISIISRRRPDFVITTGAGAVFFAVLWARILGARIILVESFARFETPSKFALICAFLAHYRVVQSAKLARSFKGAVVFDPLKIIDRARPDKKPLLFATVGATLPFDRLAHAIEDLKLAGHIPEEIILQTGLGGYTPSGFPTFETMRFEEIQSILAVADIVVCHGGTGSVITALRQGCRVVVMPRLVSRGEHYDDHQADITKAFVARGLIETANSVDELAAALIRVRQSDPICATTDPGQLIAYLENILEGRVQSLQRRTANVRSQDPALVAAETVDNPRAF